MSGALSSPEQPSLIHANPIHGRRLQMLGELAEIGLDVARAIGRQAQDPQAGQTGDLALAYARVSRAVRLTLMLQAQLIEDEAAEAEARDTADPAPPSPEEIRKARVTRIVERLVTAEHRHDVDLADELVAEAGERLDDEDVYGDLMQRPMSEIVARLARDLGLEPDWARLAGELWASEELASGEVGAPLMSYLPREARRGGELCDGQRLGRHANACSSLQAGVAEERLVEGASHKRHALASHFQNTA